MVDKYPPIAKITRPTITGILPRERPFRFLDSGLNRPIVWISGPAGSGKTTLIASYLDARKLPSIWYQIDKGDADIATLFYYMGLAAEKVVPGGKPLPLLTAEYLAGIPVFARRYFETLYSRLSLPPSPDSPVKNKDGFVIVFDDYQAAPDGSEFHEMILNGLDVIPQGINVIIASRSDPPPHYARFRANSKISFLGWDEIRFTLDESKEIVQLRGQGAPIDDIVTQLHAKTEGWIAGLVLFMEILHTSGSAPHLPDGRAPQEVFDYFAGEIFNSTDKETQDFLLKTAFLPRITAQTAAGLTGVTTSEQILSTLHRNHYFTEMHSRQTEHVYQYHPLFREFLLSKARDSFSRVALAQIQKNAAALLEESGQEEDAAALFCDAQDWDRLVRLVLTRAQALAEQGRSSTLMELFSRIPEEVMKNNPWLLFWLGICKLPFDPRDSRTCFEQAFVLFKEQKEPSGLYLSWSGIVETFLYEKSSVIPLDRWISEFELLQREYPEFPSPEIYARAASGIFCALMYRQPQHPDLPLWEKRLKEIILGSADTSLRMLISSQLILYYTWWTGEMAQAKLLVDILRPAALLPDIAPLALIVWRSIESIYYWMLADREACSDAVKKGLEVAEASGIHILDDTIRITAVYSALESGDMETARKYISNMAATLAPERLQEVIFYHYLSAWEALCLHDLPLALEHAKAGLKTAMELGMPYGLGSIKSKFAELLFECGEYQKAKEYLNDARRIASEMKSKTLEYECLLAETKFLFDQGEHESALHSLRKYLELTRKNGSFNEAWWRSSVMVRLYAKALEAGIETDHVKEVIRRHNLVPDASLLYIESWPYSVKIYTLGKFEIVINEKPAAFPASFSGKVQQKPLSMLKALISSRNREISEGQLTDLLWPDAEGDLAHRSFYTNLGRLRSLLVNDSAIRIREGRLTLNSKYCWVDAWAFEQIVEQVPAGFTKADESGKRRSGEGKAQKGKKGESEKRGSGDSPFHYVEMAVNLYKGHFLPMDEGLSWTVSCRERLRNKFLRLIISWGDYLEQTGQWEKAVEHYQKALAADDVAEEFYQHLMVCYQKLGRRAEITEIYNRCRSILSASLDTVPSSATEELYQKLRSEK